MEKIDHAFYNIPYLLSLNKRKVRFPPDFQIPKSIISPLLYKNLMNFSDDHSLVNNSLASRHQNETLNKPAFMHLTPHQRTFESIDKIDSNTARKVNILDEINKDIKMDDDFEEEEIESKEISNATEKDEDHDTQDPEFLFEEHIFENQYKEHIPDLDNEQIRIIDKFREYADKGMKFNETLYNFNEALFNKDEAKIQRHKTHKMMMKALEYELNKMEKHANKVEKEIKEGGEQIEEIDKHMDIINNDLKKLIYERETEALMKRIDHTIDNPLKMSDMFNRTYQGFSNINKDQIESKLNKIYQENQEVYDEADKCLERFGLYDENSFQDTQRSYQYSMQQTQKLSHSINESYTQKIIEKATTLEKELRLNRNKNLVSALENIPTDRNTKNIKISEKNKKSSVSRKKNSQKQSNISIPKNKKGPQAIKMRGIDTKY